jgi:Flp pilus assembly protein TadG
MLQVNENTRPRLMSQARYGRRNRQGAILALAVFLMVFLVGMLAFSIDIGYLAASKSEMRRTADAAALAGCWQLIDSEVAGQNSIQAYESMVGSATQAAAQNSICNHATTLETAGDLRDIRDGYLASLSPNAELSSNSDNPFRAVSVRVQKTKELNGQVPFYFAPVFGEFGREMTVEAIAAFATQIKGFKTPSNSSSSNLNILPLALDQATWNTLLAGSGTDDYRYNQDGTVTSGADGVREVNLFPQETGSPGNRGTVDIGGNNNSTADIARQIVHGISADDLSDLGKPLILGEDGTMTLNGDTGISAGVKDELASIIGQPRCIPIFSTVSGNGNNANYTIVKWVGIRIMYVKLTGSMNSKKVIVQPAALIVRNAIAGDGTRQWSDKIYSPVLLAQ